MRRKSIVTLLLFSFMFLMTHDFIMNAVDHQKTSLQHLEKNTVHADVQSLHQVHDAIDIMVLHFHDHAKPKHQEPVYKTPFALILKDSTGNRTFLERPPTA